MLEPEFGGATQGFEPDWQICPTAALPLDTPFTSHVTVRSEVFVSEADTGILWPSSNVDDAGVTVTLMLLTRVTDAAAAVAPLAVPSLAWIVTAAGDGITAGAK